MGLDWTYDGPADVFAEMKRNMRSLDNITWDGHRLRPVPDGIRPWQDGAAEVLPPDEHGCGISVEPASGGRMEAAE
jgi:hypothetical protein